MGRSGKIKPKKEPSGLPIGRPKKQYTSWDYENRQQARLGASFTKLTQIKTDTGATSIKDPKTIEKIIKQSQPKRTSRERELDDRLAAIWGSENPYAPPKKAYSFAIPQEPGYNLKLGQADGDLGRSLAHKGMKGEGTKKKEQHIQKKPILKEYIPPKKEPKREYQIKTPVSNPKSSVKFDAAGNLKAITTGIKPTKIKYGTHNWPGKKKTKFNLGEYFGS